MAINPALLILGVAAGAYALMSKKKKKTELIVEEYEPQQEPPKVQNTDNISGFAPDLEQEQKICNEVLNNAPLSGWPITFNKPFPYNKWKHESQDQTYIEYLTNIVYWTVYPNAVTKIPKRTPTLEQEAWNRIYVCLSQEIDETFNPSQLPLKS